MWQEGRKGSSAGRGRGDGPAARGGEVVDPGFAGHFGSLEGRAWLNTAHQGVLSRPAAAAVAEEVERKSRPYRLAAEDFFSLPRRLRAALERLVGAAPGEVALANSSSYGLHLVADGFPWRAGDEVLLVEGDFPSTLLPFLALAGAGRGVTARRIRPRGRWLEPDDLRREIGPATRMLVTTWVHSFRGVALDLEALGSICRERGVTFVVNGSQAVGARPVDVSRLPIDALTSVGFKWLCGPYGTGFVWLRPELRDRLRVLRAYWLTALSSDDLAAEELEPEIPTEGIERLDVFGTANFFQYAAWLASVELLSGIGIERIAAHDQALVERLAAGVETLDGYELVSPRRGPERSTLVLLRHRDPGRHESIYEALLAAGVHGALRAGSLRFSPHLYNGPEDVDRALAVLRAVA